MGPNIRLPYLHDAGATPSGVERESRRIIITKILMYLNDASLRTGLKV